MHAGAWAAPPRGAALLSRVGVARDGRSPRTRRARSSHGPRPVSPPLLQPAVQFCTEAFSEYTRLTDADTLFGQQFKNLEFFRYFWQVRATPGSAPARRCDGARRFAWRRSHTPCGLTAPGHLTPCPIAHTTTPATRPQYNVFLFTILGFALLTLIYLSIFPSDRDHLNKARAASQPPRRPRTPRVHAIRSARARALTRHRRPVARPCPLPHCPGPQVMQAIKAKKGAEMKTLDRKLQQQGGALSAVQGDGGGGRKGKR